MKLSKLFNILANIIIAFIVALCAVIMLPKVFGYEVYGILSGSMLPSYPIGSIIYVQHEEANNIEVGDVITFNMAAGSDVVATHRVVEINSEEETFTTKGDNNDTVDSSPVSFERLIGKIVLCIPMLGYVADFIQSTNGIIAGVGAIVLVFALWFLSDYFKKHNK